MASGGIRKLGQRLLHLWVRPRVFPEQAEALGVDPQRPVFYVLREGWLTDRLVMRDAVERMGLPLVLAGSRSVINQGSPDFSLMRAWRPFCTARERYGMPAKLLRLVEFLRIDAMADVQLVPVTVLWGRAPTQQDAILPALTSESWQRRSPLGHLLAVLIHGRLVHVHFGQPFSLRTLMADTENAAHAAKQCARVLRLHFRRQRELAIGPDVSHRQTEVDTLLAAPAVQAAIAAEAEQKGQPRDKVRAQARRNALAIVSDYSYSVVRAGELFLTWLWTKIFEGVEVRNLDAIAAMAEGKSLVYVPCHRSHLDYLLLSYVIFRGGLRPPHVAAGDNLDLPLIGPILRRGGAFFLRRSFKGDHLYSTVFEQYLHLMLARGFPIEFFIEGGRSRNGRLLAPRAGLLGMTVRSFVRRHERPLVFVPVYIGYEKLPEGKSFVAELAGRPKRRESLLGLLSAVKVLRRRFGKAYVNFGPPMALADWLDEHHSVWRNVAPESVAEATWLHDAVGGIADELSRRINAAAMLNPVNLVALALLASPQSQADVATLERQIDHLLALRRDEQADVLAMPMTCAGCVATALKLGSVHGTAGTSIAANDDEAALLAYFRNNVLHLFALPALVAVMVLQHAPLTEARLEGMVAGLFGLLRDKLYLRLEARELPVALEALLSRLATRGLVEWRDGQLHAPPAGSTAHTDLVWLAEIVRPLLASVASAV